MRYPLHSHDAGWTLVDWVVYRLAQVAESHGTMGEIVLGCQGDGSLIQDTIDLLSILDRRHEIVLVDLANVLADEVSFNPN